MRDRDAPLSRPTYKPRLRPVYLAVLLLAPALILVGLGIYQLERVRARTTTIPLYRGPDVLALPNIPSVYSPDRP